MSIATNKLAPRVVKLVSTTPRRMTASLIACIAMTLVATIVASQHIQALSADADASALNAVLTQDTPNGPSWSQYRKDINQLHDELVTASQNITYGNEERDPILTIARNVSLYEYTMGQTLGKTAADANVTLTAGHQLFRQNIRPASI